MIRPRTNSTISAGTRVTDRIAAAAMAKVLVKASGPNSRPSWLSRVKIGRNETVMMRSEKNSDGPTSDAASTRISTRGLPGGARSRCLWAFSIMTMAASIMAPTAMAMPPRLMMLAPSPSARMPTNAIRMPTGSIRMATSALRTCSRNTMQTSETTTLSSTSVCLQGVDGRVDELRAVVDRQDLGARGQAFRHLRELRLDALDDVQRVRAEALQDDAAGDLALAVHLGDAATLVGPELDPGDVPHPQRRAAVGLEDDVLDVGDAPQVAAPAHHELELGELDRAAADVGVARPDRVAELVEGDALGAAGGSGRRRRCTA